MRHFPGRLHHETPPWVADTAVFHIRIRAARWSASSLVDPTVAAKLMESVVTYNERQRWVCFLFVLLPDHLHGLFSFAREPGMGRTLADWKRYHAVHSDVAWQDNFFDHRIRSAAEYSEAYAYIERNPVALGLCAFPEDWPYRCAAFGPESVPNF